MLYLIIRQLIIMFSGNQFTIFEKTKLNNYSTLDTFTANQMLLELLKNAKEDENLQLTRILENDTAEPFRFQAPHAPEILMREITIAGGNSFANTFRQQGNSYWDILDDVAKAVLKKEEFKRYSAIERYDDISYFNKEVCEHAKKLYLKSEKIDFTKCKDPKQEEKDYLDLLDNQPDLFKDYIPRAIKTFYDYFNNRCLELEEKIVFKILDMKYSTLSTEDKRKFDQAVYEIAVEKGLTSSRLSKGVAGLILIGEMGGFTTYMLMSIFLSKIGLGVFGFSVFTGASTLLGIVLGPAGWLASGSWILWEISSPSKNKMAQLVTIIALIRLRIQEDEKAKLVEKPQSTKDTSKKSVKLSKNFSNRINYLLGYPTESPQFSYQNLKHKKNKKGRKKF